MNKFDDLFEKEFSNCDLENLAREDIKIKLDAWLNQKIGEEVNLFFRSNIDRIYKEIINGPDMYKSCIHYISTKVKQKLDDYIRFKENEDYESLGTFYRGKE